MTGLSSCEAQVLGQLFETDDRVWMMILVFIVRIIIEQCTEMDNSQERSLFCLFLLLFQTQNFIK